MTCRFNCRRDCDGCGECRDTKPRCDDCGDELHGDDCWELVDGKIVCENCLDQRFVEWKEGSRVCPD